MINGPGHPSEQCKILNNFGKRYATVRHFRECMQDPTDAKKYRGKQEVNYTFHHAVDDIIMQEVEDKKLSA